MLTLEQDRALKLYGEGPAMITPNSGVLSFYKFDTGSKSFKEIPSRSFTSTTDAVTVQVKRNV